MNIICSNCQNSNAEDTNFCIHCGTRLNGETCQCINIGSDNYCLDCGKLKMITPKSFQFTFNMEIDSNLAAVSDVGRKHKSNQDSTLVGVLNSGKLVLIVADGVSTSQNSEQAAKLAVDTIFNELNMEKSLDNSIIKAHNKIKEMAYTHNSSLDEPMCTIVVGVIDGLNLSVSWVGDSRAYVINEKNSLLITRDDSWVSDAVDAGMSEQEATKSIHAHEITQCLGTRDMEPQINNKTQILEPNSKVLLCSDGLWNYFDSVFQMKKFMDKYPNFNSLELCNNFVSYANQCGGRDNISIALKII